MTLPDGTEGVKYEAYLHRGNILEHAAPVSLIRCSPLSTRQQVVERQSSLVGVRKYKHQLLQSIMRQSSSLSRSGNQSCREAASVVGVRTYGHQLLQSDYATVRALLTNLAATGRQQSVVGVRRIFLSSGCVDMPVRTEAVR
jgi:hypothetical protein